MGGQVIYGVCEHGSAWLWIACEGWGRLVCRACTPQPGDPENVKAQTGRAASCCAQPLSQQLPLNLSPEPCGLRSSCSVYRVLSCLLPSSI